MKLSFNLSNSGECADVLALIAGYHSPEALGRTSHPETPPAPEQPAPVAAEAVWLGATETEQVIPTTVMPTPVPDQAEPAPVDPQAGVELDANGSPWIEAVHATTKTQTVKGVWKSKRGVDKDVVAEAEAAARAKISGTPQPVTPDEPVVPESDAPAPVTTMADLSQAWLNACELGVANDDMAAEMYASIGVVPSQLAVNETMRATMVKHLQSLMAPAPVSSIPGV